MKTKKKLSDVFRNNEVLDLSKINGGGGPIDPDKIKVPRRPKGGKPK